jgi:LmbE family N-acetylglucosaminyl deacetylase
MSQLAIGAHVPQVRPHIHRRDGSLFFMISRRPLLELSPDEVAIYESIDGRKTVAEIELTHPGAAELLVRWQEASILELFAPTSSPTGPHLVVIEPHMDDAALSVGGRLLNRRGRCRITILSVVKWSNFTSYLLSSRNALTVAEVTTLREQESALAARLLGAGHLCLDWSDAPIRLLAAERWSTATMETFKQDPGAFVHLFPNQQDVSQIAEKLKRALAALSPDEIWIPMGLGDHVDHRTTRSACLRMLADSPEMFSKIPVEMYEEIPYERAVAQAAQIESALASTGTRLSKGVEDITDSFDEKLRAVSVYASQFKLSYMETRLREAAQRVGGAPGKLGEAYRRVEGPLRPPPESRLSRNFAPLAALQTNIPLIANTTARRRLTLITLPSGHLAKWKANSEMLATAFPNADLRVYVSNNVAWEAEEGGNGRWKLCLIRNGWRGWAGAIWRELFHFQTPTVVLWSGAYGTGFMRKLIRSLLPFRHVLFAKTLSDFCGVLNEQIDPRHLTVDR